MTTENISPRRRRPSFGRSRSARSLDCFDTPVTTLAPLFAHEPLLAGVSSVVEPFAGAGNLVVGMRARGLTVFAPDIAPRGCPGCIELDFLKMTARPAGRDVLISNCAYAGAMNFIEHALALEFRVIALLFALQFLCSADRFTRLHGPGHLRRIHIIAERLQGMHDANHLAKGGPIASQSQHHCWLIFDRNYCGCAVVNPISPHVPGARMPWADEGAP
jgi:hypothetical protein